MLSLIHTSSGRSLSCRPFTAPILGREVLGVLTVLIQMTGGNAFLGNQTARAYSTPPLKDLARVYPPSACRSSTAATRSNCCGGLCPLITTLRRVLGGESGQSRHPPPCCEAVTSASSVTRAFPPFSINFPKMCVARVLPVGSFGLNSCGNSTPNKTDKTDETACWVVAATLGSAWRVSNSS
jgi:hypothetical protein